MLPGPQGAQVRAAAGGHAHNPIALGLCFVVDQQPGKVMGSSMVHVLMSVRLYHPYPTQQPSDIPGVIPPWSGVEIFSQQKSLAQTLWWSVGACGDTWSVLDCRAGHQPHWIGLLISMSASYVLIFLAVCGLADSCICCLFHCFRPCLEGDPVLLPAWCRSP